MLDPTLNVDTRLFIDPLMLDKSSHPEIAEGSRRTYEQHFTTIIKFLSKATGPTDVAWRSAQRLLSFPEIKWTCLGYGAESVSGSGSGTNMTGQFIETARQIVSLGVDDPDLFVAMALFEEGVGPDRISDMTTNVILGDLLRFNTRVLAELGVPGKPMQLRLRNGKAYEATLPVNPYLPDGGPVILVPADVLRHLPVATDWSEVADAASENEQLRSRVNEQIAKLWEVRSRKDKGKLRRWALTSREEFETFLDMIKGAKPRPYDLSGDPLGEMFWRRLAATLADQVPLTIKKPPSFDYAGVVSVVEQIIEQFRFLVEDRRFSEELYHAGEPRPEKAAQRLFFAAAHAYCKANDLDLTPEADTGNGPVDFKVSKGYAGRVLVEIKLSRNGKLVSGYTKQLEAYKTAEETLHGFYVVVDVGQMGEKDTRLLQIKNEAAERGEQVSPVIFVDGTRRASASKL
ncbi:hypothetical protein [Rhodobacter sp. CZR27]|uniref:hypothetical protein n=1 Tax=Rhodobacter sp. CZR27 TaxID=2033869 RepID=UPI000BBF057C|nr:hypothetical protein [Rhodobacter sp. CZR27]